jgi:hypothetical protein
VLIDYFFSKNVIASIFMPLIFMCNVKRTGNKFAKLDSKNAKALANYRNFKDNIVSMLLTAELNPGSSKN